jgi:Na+-translocating ferredoxin:NAD+ oxidoreductase RNF subunit RnfB
MDSTDSKLSDIMEDLEKAEQGPRLRSSEATPPQSSVRLDPERCVGCAACMRVCPTEAIRIRKGKALIKPHICIDCGECVRVCEYKAGIILADPVSYINAFEYRIAIPEASLYGQFVPGVLPNHILNGLLDLGFHEVFEAALCTERVSLLLREYLDRYHGPKPLITSFCPVVMRLIQLRFPELIHLVVPVDSALELAIKELKELRSRELGISTDLIGAFYLTGCPARITTIVYPYTGAKTYLDGAISIGDIYRDLMFAIRRRQREGAELPQMHKSGGLGIRWGTLGGELELLDLDSAIAVSEIKHLLRVMEDIDNHKLTDIQFVECRSCYGGCAGGPLLVDNPYRGRAKIQMLSRKFSDVTTCDEQWVRENFERYRKHFDRRLAPHQIGALASDPSSAIEKMAQKAKILKSLPGIDCGSCGAPNCRALAHDIVRGEANVMHCIFKLRDAFLRQKHEKRSPSPDELNI